MKNIDRRTFLKATGTGALAAAVPSAVQCATREPRDGRLNVLFLMTDEQHHRSLSLTGNTYIETPAMDRIGREGVRFDNATCVTPYCSPTRASLLTGVYPHTHGILRNVNLRRGGQAPLEQDAFPNTETLLHKADYATAHRGKWHLGNKGRFDCYESFEYAAKTSRAYRSLLEKHLPAADFADHPSPGSYLGRPVEMTPKVLEGYRKFVAMPNNPLSYIATIGRSVIPPRLLPETQITSQVLDLLDENAERNFMITASWSPPHDLWVIPEPYYSMVDRGKVVLPGTTDMPAWDQRGPSKRLGDTVGPEGVREFAAIYHGMVKYIDDQLGRVLKKLDELGLADNTLVIFTSDHGDMAGAHGCIGKSISSIYDDLLRVPLLMRLPGRIKPGTVVSEPVSHIDYMPTILDYLGRPEPENIHGRSMRPLIEGRDVPWRDYAFCQRANVSRMLRTDRWKLFYSPRPRMLALYDLKNDPHEDHNLANDPAHAKTVRQMHRRLVEVMTADGDPQRERFSVDPLG